MKKSVIYLFLILFLCFLLPVCFTIPFQTKQVANTEEQKNQITTNTYDYKNYQTIRLLHKKTAQIEEVKLDDYLYHVVSSEMPADFQLEALKAQAVVARTYTIYKVIHNEKKHEGDICDDSTCCQAWISKEDRLAKWGAEKAQAYWDKIVEAVNSTQGKIITYNNEPINAFFHANSGGVTEVPVNVWGGSGYPYLQSVQTAGEDAYGQYYSEVTLSKEELSTKIKEKHEEFVIDWNAQDAIAIIEKEENGRVKTLRVGNVSLAGVEARSIIGLKSTNFEILMDGDKITFKVIGYGHGVGMSQTGADSMAKAGSNYEAIITHFYTDVLIQDM